MLFHLLFISLPVPIFQCSAFCINFLVHNLRDFLNIQQTGSLFPLCWDPGEVRTGHPPAWLLITSTERTKGQSCSRSATEKPSENCGRPKTTSDREDPSIPQCRSGSYPILCAWNLGLCMELPAWNQALTVPGCSAQLSVANAILAVVSYFSYQSWL